MLHHPTLNALHQLKLFGMAQALQRHLEQPAIEQLSFEERLAMLVDAETTHRTDRRCRRLLQLAKLKQDACLEDLDLRPQRGLPRSRIATLTTLDWIRARQHLLITGPTGSGKSWIACAFGRQACRQGFSVRYERTPRLLEDLRLARADGSYPKRLLQLAKTDLLILDDWGLKPLSQTEKHDLLEVLEDRYALRSTLLTSQLPIDHWHPYINDPTVADAILDRLLTNAHRLELTGESLRKKTLSLTYREQPQ